MVDYAFQKDTVTKIIIEFKKQVKENAVAFKKAIEIDCKMSLCHFDFSSILNVFHCNISPLEQSDFVVENGIGTVGVIYNGNPSITAYLSLMALQTHNHVVFFINDSMIATNELFIGLLKKVLEQFSYGKNAIQICKNPSERDILSHQNEFATMLVVGNPKTYQDWQERLHIPVIYHGYGHATFYIDEERNFEKELLEINQYVFTNNIQSEVFRNNPKEAIQTINQFPYCDLVVLFTKNKDLAKYFIGNVKCKKLVINQNPFKNYMFELDEKLFVQKKQIIF